MTSASARQLLKNNYNVYGMMMVEMEMQMFNIRIDGTYPETIRPALQIIALVRRKENCGAYMMVFKKQNNIYL